MQAQEHVKGTALMPQHHLIQHVYVLRLGMAWQGCLIQHTLQMKIAAMLAITGCMSVTALHACM